MPRSSKPVRCKAVMVGESGCGKTSALMEYVDGRFPYENVLAHYITPMKRLVVDQRPVEMMLWDTVGRPEYDSIRALSYPETHVVLVCFGVDSREAFEKMEQRWVPEVRKSLPNTPLVVLATKTDLRDPGNGVNRLNTVLVAEGRKMADRLGAVGYYECLAKRGEGLREACEQLMRVALQEQARRRRRCVVV